MNRPNLIATIFLQKKTVIYDIRKLLLDEFNVVLMGESSIMFNAKLRFELAY